VFLTLKIIKSPLVLFRTSGDLTNISVQRMWDDPTIFEMRRKSNRNWYEKKTWLLLILILIKCIDAVLSFFFIMSVECALGHYAKENFGLQLLCNG
jgi:hypothetical protein